MSSSLALASRSCGVESWATSQEPVRRKQRHANLQGTNEPNFSIYSKIRASLERNQQGSRDHKQGAQRRFPAESFAEKYRRKHNHEHQTYPVNRRHLGSESLLQGEKIKKPR